MSFPVKISEIVEAIDLQTDETTAYLNKESAEIVTISEEEFNAAEDQEPIENYPEWQWDNIRIAREILDNKENFLSLPTRYDIDEYQIMARFCLSVESRQASQALLSALRGKGAFRRFKGRVHRFGIQDEWYRYREEAIKQIAIDWCESNSIEFEEE